MLAWIMLVISLVTTPPPPHVVMVTIDGTRYQEVFQGTDPHLYHGRQLTAPELVPNMYHYFVEQGIVVGKLSPMTASGPNFISLPGYLEITRGHPSQDCQSNDCRPQVERSILQLYHTTAVFSSWEGIGRTIPLNFSGYTDIGAPHYRWDPETETKVFQYLNQGQPDFLWVSLGDTDEYAHQNNYIEYINALYGADNFIGQLIQRCDPNTIFMITVDHGRNKNFRDHGRDHRSRRVWLMIRGPGIPYRGFVKADSISLSNIYPTIVYLHSGVQSPDSILSRIQ